MLSNLNFHDEVSATENPYTKKIEDEKLDFLMSLCIGNLFYTFLLSCINYTDVLLCDSITSSELFQELRSLK